MRCFFVLFSLHILFSNILFQNMTCTKDFIPWKALMLEQRNSMSEEEDAAEMMWLMASPTVVE